MIDHVRTLLLNLPASSVEGASWAIDPSFAPVNVPDRLVPVRTALFNGTSDSESMARRVDAVYRLLRKPEFSFAMELFDRRTSESEGPPSTVFGFYESASPSELDVVEAIALSGSQNAVFSIPDGMPDKMSSTISSLGYISKSTPETVARFVSVVLAYVIQLEYARSLSVGRTQA